MSGRWRLGGKDERDEAQVYPLGEPEHVTDGGQCWCGPEEIDVREEDDDPPAIIVIHKRGT